MLAHLATLTRQVDSCSLPSLGRMKGAIWRHRNVCTDTGKPRSCSPLSWSKSKSSLLLFAAWLLLFVCRLLLFMPLVAMLVAVAPAAAAAAPVVAAWVTMVASWNGKDTNQGA